MNTGQDSSQMEGEQQLASGQTLEKRRVGNRHLRNWIRSTVQSIHIYPLIFRISELVLVVKVKELGDRLG